MHPLSRNDLATDFDCGACTVLSGTRMDLCEFGARQAMDLFACRGDPVVQLDNSAPHKTPAETVQYIEPVQDAFRQGKARQGTSVLWSLRPHASHHIIGSVSVGLNRLEIWTSVANANVNVSALRLTEQLGFSGEGILGVEYSSTMAILMTVTCSDASGPDGNRRGEAGSDSCRRLTSPCGNAATRRAHPSPANPRRSRDRTTPLHSGSAGSAPTHGCGARVVSPVGSSCLDVFVIRHLQVAIAERVALRHGLYDRGHGYP